MVLLSLGMTQGLVELTNLALKGFLSSDFKSNNDLFRLNEEEILLLDYDIAVGKYAEQIVCNYVDNLLATINPVEPSLLSKPDTHPCKRSFHDLSSDNLDLDYAELVNSVQKHVCSSLYFLKDKEGKLICTFNYPFDLCSKTHLEFLKVHSKDGSAKYRAEIRTARIDSRFNRHQRVQLQGCSANCDISIVIDYNSCLEYLTKYASKPKKISSVAKDAFVHVANSVNEENFDSVKVIKKLMMRAVGLHDMSIQEVCHQILKLKLHSSSFEVLTVSLDGSRKVENIEGELISKWSQLDLYAHREDISSKIEFRNSNFVNFHANFCLKNSEIKRRPKAVVITTIPIYSSYRKGVNYGKYCKYNLIKYKVWRRTISSLWGDEEESDESFIARWEQFLQTDEASELVPEHAYELENVDFIQPENDCETEENVIEVDEEQKEWMFLSKLHNNEVQNENDSTEFESEKVDPDYFARFTENMSVQDIADVPSWIYSQKSLFVNNNISVPVNEGMNIAKFNVQQRKAFNLVINHAESGSTDQLLLSIVGKAGSRKSFLINRLRYALGEKCFISACSFWYCCIQC